MLANLIVKLVRFPTSASRGPSVMISPSITLGTMIEIFLVTLLANTPLACWLAVKIGVAVTGTTNSPANGNSSPGPSIANQDWNISPTSNPETELGVTLVIHRAASLFPPLFAGVNKAAEVVILASTPPVTVPPRL